jgi:hypothetical protein
VLVVYSTEILVPLVGQELCNRQAIKPVESLGCVHSTTDVGESMLEMHRTKQHHGIGWIQSKSATDRAAGTRRTTAIYCNNNEHLLLVLGCTTIVGGVAH